jgi:hypothetical protein
MKETDAGLYVEGKLDIHENEIAREALRSMKAGAMSLSIGYLVTADHKREDGIRELHGIDLFEVSIVPHPASPDTRVLSMKSAPPLDLLGSSLDPSNLEQLQAEFEQATKGIETRPLRIASFEC